MTKLFSKIDTSQFTDNDFAIMNFITENEALLSHLSLHELATRLYFSDAMIVRFCHKIGLSGFNELKFTLKNQHKTSEHLMQFRFQTDQRINELNTLVNAVSEKQLAKIVHILKSEAPLYIHGRSLSSIPARYLHTLLNSLDRRCILIEELHLLSSICSTIQADSIALIISAKAENPAYDLAFQNAQKNGATTVLLTSNKQSSLTPFSNIILFSNDQPEFFKGTDVNSRIQLLTLVQLIIEKFSQK